MSLLPSTERILMGPGPSPVAPRVMRAMAAPVLSHLDPQMMQLLDDLRARLGRVFHAHPGAFTCAVSGTGTAGMEAAVATLVKEGTSAVVVVTGYFGERLAEMCRRYGATVRRVESPWGRAADPEALRHALREQRADLVAMVHAETSTGVLNPVDALCAVAREHDALTIVDTVTSLGGHPVDVAAWGADVAYSGSQKALGAPSGMAPVTFGPRALAANAKRSFYLDAALLQDYWINRKYHHTISAPLVYALHEALVVLGEEGLEVRWARHQRRHEELVSGLEAMGLRLLPPPAERLWTLNAVCVPKGIDEAAVRRYLLEEFSLEVGAGLGPLAGRVWRVGLMGAGASRPLVLLFLGALGRALEAQGASAGRAAAQAAGTSLSSVR
jgi:alanine-glyoxylate transaminase/serine-glyoxylate transaminase/serine-pyruvate transaminase